MGLGESIQQFFFNEGFLEAYPKIVSFSPYKLAQFKTQQSHLKEVQTHVSLNSHIGALWTRCFEGIFHWSAKPEMAYMCSLSHVRLFVTSWTVAHQAPLWNFPAKNTGVGCHFLLQGIFATQGSNPCLFSSPALAGRLFTTVPPGKPILRHQPPQH